MPRGVRRPDDDITAIKECAICGQGIRRRDFTCLRDFQKRRTCSKTCMYEYRRANAPTAVPLAERFWQKVDKRGPDDCWTWTASTSYGYGKLGIGGKRGGWKQAHIVSWELHNGPVPKGLFVCHSCDNPPCVNPQHLFVGTALDNNMDKAQKGRASRGEQRWNARLTPRGVQKIRSLHRRGIDKTAIAQSMGLGRTTVHAVLEGRTWAHVQDSEAR
jgi:hypothetical protein